VAGVDPAPATGAPPIEADPFRRVSLGGLALWLAGSGGAMAVLAWLRGGRRFATDPGALLPWLALWAYGALALWLVWALPRAGISWRRLFGPLPSPARWLEPPLVAWLNLSFGANSLLAALWVVSQYSPGLVEHQLGGAGHSLPGLDTTPLGTLWLVTVIAAPVLEEVLFRGVLLHRFAARWGVRRAAVASSLLWGVMHANPVAITVFGLLLSALYVRTGSLWLPIAAHALNNAVPMALLALMRGAGGPEPMAHHDLAGFQRAIGPILMFLAGASALIVGYLALTWPRRDALTPYAANGRGSGPDAAEAGPPDPPPAASLDAAPEAR
jgi:membrane protease YdiL (CAAX protease family)